MIVTSRSCADVDADADVSRARAVAGVMAPSSRVALAVDAVASSAVTNDRLDRVKGELERRVDEASEMAGLRGRDHVCDTGDGALLSFPEEYAAQVVALVFHLDHVLRVRNREHRVPLRARLAVHCGPMVGGGRYHRPYIEVTKLLNAPAFTSAVRYCVGRDPHGDKLGAALVVSRWVWRNVVEPFRAPLVPPARCAPIRVSSTSCHDDGWIHLPGMDADMVLAGMARSQTAIVRPRVSVDEVSRGAGRPAVTPPLREEEVVPPEESTEER